MDRWRRLLAAGCTAALLCCATAAEAKTTRRARTRWALAMGAVIVLTAIHFLPGAPKEHKAPPRVRSAQSAQLPSLHSSGVAFSNMNLIGPPLYSSGIALQNLNLGDPQKSSRASPLDGFFSLGL